MTHTNAAWRPWNQQFADGGLFGVQTRLHGTDQTTRVLRNFETRLVPGMLQTRAYAHAVFAKISALRGLGGDVAAAVEARLGRRAYLADADRTFEFIVTESVLTEPAHGHAIQIEQVEHLQTLLTAPTTTSTVRIGILPADRPLPLVAEHAFALHDDTGVIEGFLGELHVGGEDAAFLHRVMDVLWTEALEGDDARLTAARALDSLRSSPPDRT